MNNVSCISKGKLVPLAEEHLKIIYNWRNLPRIKESMFNSSEIQWDNHQEWFEKTQKEKIPLHYIFLYNNVPFGYLSFTNFNLNKDSFSWGFYIGEINAKKGLSYLMGMLGIQKAFHEFNANTLFGEVIEDNFKSKRYHLQLGFSLNSPNLFCKNNKNYYLYSYEKKDWIKKKNEIENELKVIFKEVF